MWLSGQRHAPVPLPPIKTRYPLHRKLGGPQGPSARVQNISPPVGFDPRAVHPVSSRYSDGAITAHTYFRQKNNHKLHVRLIYPLLLKYQWCPYQNMSYLLRSVLSKNAINTQVKAHGDLASIVSCMSASFVKASTVLMFFKTLSRNLYWKLMDEFKRKE